MAAVALDTPPVGDAGCSEALILRFGEEEREPGMILVYEKGLGNPSHNKRQKDGTCGFLL